MELVQNTDSCLSGKRPEELVRYEVKDLANDQTLKLSSHGWLRHAQCAAWGAESGKGQYAIGLKQLWGPREAALW